MTSGIIGGHGTGLFDSSLFLLNRNDRTGQGSLGNDEQLFVNVANGNLIISHRDGFLPSQGQDYLHVRTYNSRGAWGSDDGRGWSGEVASLDLSRAGEGRLTLVNPDGSRSNFVFDAVSGRHVSVDGAGAFEVAVADAQALTWSVTRADGTVLSFDADGVLTQSRDLAGNLITYTYASGLLQSVQDDQGHLITYVRSAGNLVRIEDETGAVLSAYEYTQGMLTGVVDRAGRRTTYTYNAAGTIESITLPAGTGDHERTVRFEYESDPSDGNGGQSLRLRALIDAEGNRTEFRYAIQTGSGSSYAGGGTAVISALGLQRRTSNAAEDSAWRVANGFYATYDAANQDAAYLAQGEAILALNSVIYEYDTRGAITSVTDQSGYRTRYQYDAQENLVAVVDANGDAVVRSDDAYWRDMRRDLGLVTLTGEGKSVSDLTAGEIAALRDRFTTRMEYDAQGNLVRRADGAGGVASYTYTAFNAIASHTSAMGHALATSNESIYSDRRVALGYAADAAALSTADQDALRALFTTTYSYDADNDLVEIRTPGGDLTRFEHDAEGNVTRRVVYLDASDLVDPAKQQVTQYFYDAYGQNIRAIDAEGNETRNSFDHFGNVLTQTDGRGHVSSFTYDAGNRLLTATDRDGNATVYSYDAVGNRTAVQDANGHTVVYVYDRNNMLVATIAPDTGSPSGGNRTSTFTYDVVGNRTRAVDAEGRLTTYVYRADNRLLEVRLPATQDASGTTQVQYAARYEYDGVGNQIAVTDFNGNRSAVAYDERGVVRRRTDASGNVTEYRYDANLNQIQVVVGAQLAADRRRVLRFAFDEEDQLVSETDALGHSTQYTRDAVGNVVATIDANGHRTDYRFDRNNRLVEELRAGVINPATGAEVRHGVVHQYDANGNTVAVTDEKGGTTHFAFDRNDRVVLVEDANGIRTVYTYDSRGNRTSVAIGVQAHLDADGRVVVDGAQQAQVESFAYDEFNQLVSRTDAVGHALVTSDSALYQAMRQQMGFAATANALSAADRDAILAAYTTRFVHDRVGNVVQTTDAQGRVSSIAYDALDRAVEMTDALNQVTRQRYDGNGNVVATVDALGHASTLAYDAANRLIRGTDASGAVTETSYDSLGNIASITRGSGTVATADGLARTATFEYDLSGRMVRSVDSQGNERSFEYDAVGNRLRVVDGRGQAQQFVYDARNRVVRTLDPLGLETRFEYDAAGQQVAVIDARGGITRTTYDPGRRLVSTTDAQGRVTELEYDVRGNVVLRRDGAGVAEEQVTTFEYDAANNLRAVVDALGGRSEREFDRVYNLVSTTDAEGRETTYGYDALNRQLTVDAPSGQLTYTYDAVGNRLTSTDALGRVTTMAYDAVGRAITVSDANGTTTSYGYDAVGNRVTVTEALGLDEERTTTYTYDANDRLIERTDALGNTTTHAYDEEGNVVGTTDALGQVTRYDYDDVGRVSRIVDALGYVTDYAYDAVGNRVRVRQGHLRILDGQEVSLPGAGQRLATAYYDLVGRQTLTVSGMGEVTSFEYDVHGRLVAETKHATRLTSEPDPEVPPTVVASSDDRTSRYVYDRLGRLSRAVDALGHLVAHSYDAVGNVVATTQYANALLPASDIALDLPAASAQDRTTSFTYDDANRLVASVDAEGYTTTYEYDAVGNRTLQVLYMDRVDRTDEFLQQRRTWQYDDLNRVVSAVDPFGVETLYGYDAVSNRVSLTEAAGRDEERITLYRYDAASRVAETEDALGTVTRYERDANGNVATEIRGYGRVDALTTAYERDALGRVLVETRADGSVKASAYDAFGQQVQLRYAADEQAAAEFSFDYAYDRAGRLVEEVASSLNSTDTTRTTYAYDALGNRTRTSVGEGTADERTRLFGHDRNGRVISETDGNGIVSLHDRDAFGNVVRTRIEGFTRRADGSTVPRTQVVTYEYDRRNLTTREASGEGRVVQREYDAAGRRVSEREGDGPGVLTRFDYHSGFRMIETRIEPEGVDGPTSYYYHDYDAFGNVTWQLVGGVDMAFVRDALGRVVQAFHGEAETRYTYDAYGNQTSVSQVVEATYQTDPDTGEDFRGVTLQTTQMAYDALGRAVLRADAMGVVTRFGYDQLGHVVEKVDAYGLLGMGEALVDDEIDLVPRQQTTHYLYGAGDRLLQEEQPTGTLVRYEYTEAGELKLKVVDSGDPAHHRNASNRWVRDSGGRVVFEVDAVGSVKHHEYDDFGNQVVSVEGLALGVDGEPSTAPVPGMRVTAREFDSLRRLTAEVIDPDGLALRTAYEYDVRGNWTATIDANGGRSEVLYDAANRPIWMRDPEGYVTTAKFLVGGERWQQTRHAVPSVGTPVGTVPLSSPSDRTAEASYDWTGRMVSSVDERGIVTTYRYDLVGNLLERVENATGLYDAAPRTTTYTYNAANLVATQSDATGTVTHYEYDATYNVIEKRVENHWLDTLVLDQDGQPTPRNETLVTSYAYDLNNRLTQESINSPSSLALRREWRYDSLGNVIAETSPNGVEAIQSDSAWALEYRRNAWMRDEEGNPLLAAELTDEQRAELAAHFTTRSWYDAAGRLIAHVAPDGLAESMAYDAVGNMVRSTIHARRFSIQEILAFDALVPPDLTADDDGGGLPPLPGDEGLPPLPSDGTPTDRVVDFEYDAAGRRTVTRTAAARQMVNGAWVDDHRAETQVAYDNAGNVLRTVDGNGYTTYQYYDSNHRLIGRIDAEGYLTTFTVDGFGNVSQERLFLDRQALSVSQKEALDLSAYVPTGPSRLVEHFFDISGHEVRTVKPATDLYEDGQLTSARVQVVRTFDAFGQVLSESILHREGDASPPTRVFEYDAAGRLVREVGARATDEPNLDFETRYAYDSAGNLREQVAAGRVTTFEYDIVGRVIRVHYPAFTAVEVGPDGSLKAPETRRAVATRTYDANGNVTTENQQDGTSVLYGYDHANHRTSATSREVSTGYSYNFAGELVEMSRSVIWHDDGAWGYRERELNGSHQTIHYELDALGRKVGETHTGSYGEWWEERISQWGYDANGNLVSSTDSRGHVATMVYDSMNRVIGTVNRLGGITETRYDAAGNVVSRQTGGWSAPELRGEVHEGAVSNEGWTLQWSMSRATQGTVFVREAGSSDSWTSFSAGEGFSVDHRISVHGLESDTAYEYFFVAEDGLGLTATSSVQVLRTAAALGDVMVTRNSATATARIDFALPAGATNVSVLVGSGKPGGVDVSVYDWITPFENSDGTYSVWGARAWMESPVFQVRWTDAAGEHYSSNMSLEAEPVAKPFVGHIEAQPQGAAQRLRVQWDLADAIAQGSIASRVQGGSTEYSVFVGVSSTPEGTPAWVQATLIGDRFVAEFAGLAEGPRTLHFQYAGPDGSLATAPSVTVAALAGLDLPVNTLGFPFQGAQAGDQVAVRIRVNLDDPWTDLPASSLAEWAADVSDLGVGGWYYEARLMRGGNAVQTESGHFEMGSVRFLTSFTNVADGSPIAYELYGEGTLASDSLNLNASETLEVTVTDALGAPIVVETWSGGFSLEDLAPGTYTVVARRIAPNGTTVVFEASGTIVVSTIAAHRTVAHQSTSAPAALHYATASSRQYAGSLTVQGQSSADHSWNYFDENGRRTFSNENGGVWTRFFYDAAGNITREVRFQRRDEQGAFINGIVDYEGRPTLTQLVADYAAAVAAWEGGADTARIMTREFDADGNVVQETEHTHTHGEVTTLTAWDRFKNKVLETTAAGIAGVESTVSYEYDALDRITRVATGAFGHRDESDSWTDAAGAAETFTYDARGYKSTHTDARGFMERFHFDQFGNMVSQWDGMRTGSASSLRTDYVYDAFDRIVQVTRNDLTGVAAAPQSEYYNWSLLGDKISYGNSAGQYVNYEYDDAGNLLSEQNGYYGATLYAYDAENQLVERTETTSAFGTAGLSGTTRYAYDAYGQRLSEQDANGRVTTYTVGAFGQVLASTTSFAGTGYSGFKIASAQGALGGSAGMAAFLRGVGEPDGLRGADSMSENHQFDWLGRLVQTTDTFGKHIVYGYNDADEQILVDDQANARQAVYEYDAAGRRIEETLSQNGLIQRHQINSYNNRGWLTGVVADAGYDAGGGASLSQQVSVSYTFDAAGNRVRVGSASYRYDAAGRMVRGFDAETGEAVTSVVYDGFGNRRQETRAGATTTYTYDAAGRVTGSSLGEEWGYDSAGNVLRHMMSDGTVITTLYDERNRAVQSTTQPPSGAATHTRMYYDAAGNVITTRVDGDGYGYEEVTLRDVRYAEQLKVITNAWARGTRGMEGTTTFQYDTNGNLVLLDRGRRQGASENSVSAFEYDAEGQIVGRSSRATADTRANFFVGYADDPDAPLEFSPSVHETVLWELFGGAASASTSLQGYIYANHRQIAEASVDQVLNLRKLTLVGGTRVGDSHFLTVQDGDIATAGSTVDRTETARRIAARAYDGFSALSAAGQQRVVEFVLQRLPEGGALQAGAEIELHGHILMVDASYTSLEQVLDYSLRRIGQQAAEPAGVYSHTVREGDTLQGIAQMYFGSPSYWYLIAEANGLQGSEALTPGTRLTVPNAVVNSVNNAETFKVYNEGEIIGTTSPEIRTIKKKKKWYQRLVQIFIVVVLIVAAIYTAGAAAGAYGVATGTATTGAAATSSAVFSSGYAAGVAVAQGVGVSGTLGAAAVAAGVGAATFAAASVVTQGMAIAADLQDKFSWRQVGQAALGGAVSGAASVFSMAAAGGANGAARADGVARALQANEVIARVGIEAGRQYLTNGRISSVSGLVGAAMGVSGSATQAYSRAFGAGMDLLEQRIRGRSDDAVGWTNFATAAFLDGTRTPSELADRNGSVNWGYIAPHLIGASIISSTRGGDATATYLGNAVGNALGASLADAMRPTQGEGPWSSKDYRNGSDIDSDNAYLDRMTQQALGSAGPGLSDSATNAEVMAYRMREAGFDGELVPVGYRAQRSPVNSPELAQDAFRRSEIEQTNAAANADAAQQELEHINEVLRETRGRGPTRAGLYNDLAQGAFRDFDNAGQRTILAAMDSYANVLQGSNAIVATGLEARRADVAVRTAADLAYDSGAIPLEARFEAQFRAGREATMALMANGLMRRPRTEAVDGAPYKLIDITAPNGRTIPAAADGNAVVALDKVSVYARGGSPDVSDELATLQAFKQQSRKSFDADPANQTRLDQLKNMQHNYERSQDMARLLENIGLPNTPQNNEHIVSNLLKTGNAVTPDNRVWVPGRLDGPNGSLVVNSTWTILPDQTAYLSTLRFMPVRK